MFSDQIKVYGDVTDETKRELNELQQIIGAVSLLGDTFYKGIIESDWNCLHETQRSVYDKITTMFKSLREADLGFRALLGPNLVKIPKVGDPDTIRILDHMNIIMEDGTTLLAIKEAHERRYMQEKNGTKKAHYISKTLLRCDICKSLQNNQSNFSRHKCAKYLPKKVLSHECPYCGKTANNRIAIDQHMPKCKKGVYYACPKCNRKFETEKSLVSHMRFHDIQALRPTCFRCQEIFLTEKQLKEHMKACDGATKCRLCNLVFATKEEMHIHFKSCKDRPKCSQCYATFSSVEEVQTHITEKHGKNP